MATLTEKQVVKVLRKIADPEIPTSIYDVGLIYAIEISETDDVCVVMTLTSPTCPVAGSLPGEVESALKQLPGVGQVRVEVTWDPPWTMERMSEAARLELGLDQHNPGVKLIRFGL